MARGPMGGGMGGRGMGGPNSFDPNRRRPKQPVGKTLLRLWKYLAGQQKKLIGLMVLILIGNVAGLLAPKVVGEAINAIGLGKGEADFPRVYVCCITLIVLYVTTDLLSYLNSRGIHKLTRDLSVHLRQDVYNKLMSLPVRYFDERQTGDILSVISYDVDTMIRSISSDVLTTVTATVTLIICLVMMLTILPTLMLVFLVTIPMSIFFARWINRTVHPLFRQRSMKRGMLNGYAEEMTSGQKTTRAYGREQQVIDGFETKNREAVQASNAAEIRSSFLGSGTSFINNFSMTLVSVFGGILLLSGKALLGDVSAFVQYSRRFVGPIREVSNILGELQAALVAAERVFVQYLLYDLHRGDLNKVYLKNLKAQLKDDILTLGMSHLWELVPVQDFLTELSKD